MRRLLLCPTAAGALALAVGSPATALQALRPAGPTAPLTGPLVGALALLAWAALAWLLLLAALTLLAGRGGRPGRLGAAVLQRAAPAALRRAVALALGVGVVLGSAGAAGAAPAPTPPVATPVAGPSLDWPGLHPAPAPAPASAPAAAPAAPPAPPGTVVVRPGDSLWSLAAGRLPPGASARAVAAAWPAWWSANRAVIGDDPDLLRPGQSLTAPVAAGEGRP